MVKGHKQNHLCSIVAVVTSLSAALGCYLTSIHRLLKLHLLLIWTCLLEVGEGTFASVLSVMLQLADFDHTESCPFGKVVSTQSEC